MPRKKNAYATFAQMMGPGIPPHVRATLFDAQWQSLTADQRENWKQYANAIRRGDTANCPPLPPGQLTAGDNVNLNAPPLTKTKRSKQKQRSNIKEYTTNRVSHSNATPHKLPHEAAAYDDVDFDPCGFEIPAMVHRSVTVDNWAKVSKWLADKQSATELAGDYASGSIEQQPTLPNELDTERKVGHGRGRLVLSAVGVGNPWNMDAVSVKGVYESTSTKQQHTVSNESGTPRKVASEKKIARGRGRRMLPVVPGGEPWQTETLGMSNATTGVTAGTANKC